MTWSIYKLLWFGNKLSIERAVWAILGWLSVLFEVIFVAVMWRGARSYVYTCVLWLCMCSFWVICADLVLWYNKITQGAEFRPLECKHECNYVWAEFRSILYMSTNVWAESRVYCMWTPMWVCMSFRAGYMNTNVIILGWFYGFVFELEYDFTRGWNGNRRLRM